MQTTTFLVEPSADLRVSFLEAMREFEAETGQADTGGLSAEGLAKGDSLEFYTRGLREGTCMRTGIEPLKCCEWWLVEDTADGLVYLGRVFFRRYPGRRDGHLEFAVRPSRRRKGHGTTLLALALPIAKANGIDHATLVCADGNEAACKVIEANGGNLGRVAGGQRWYQVPTSFRVN